jgi:hypothetical protein
VISVRPAKPLSAVRWARQKVQKMEKVTKKQVLNNLENEWPEFIRKIDSLPTERKKLYLQKQGFDTEAALLSHIIAWWKDAYKNIFHMKNDPSFKSPNQDVDKFNAEIIKNSNKLRNEVESDYEQTREKLLQIVESLDDNNFDNPEIQKELFWDITNHLKDHFIE